jgi:hypothetical protein
MQARRAEGSVRLLCGGGADIHARRDIGELDRNFAANKGLVFEFHGDGSAFGFDEQVSALDGRNFAVYLYFKAVALAQIRWERRQLNRIVRKPFRYRFRRRDDLGRVEFPCAGIQAIWQSHIEPGNRNNCTIRLASEFRLLSLTADETNEKLLEWNVNNGIEPSGG